MANNSITFLRKVYPGNCEKLHWITMLITTVWITFFHPEQKANLIYLQIYAKIMPEKDHILKQDQGKNLWRLHSLSMQTQKHCLKKFKHVITVIQHVALHYLHICSFNSNKSKLTFSNSGDCMKKFSADLIMFLIKIINYETKETLPLTDEEIES